MEQGRTMAALLVFVVLLGGFSSAFAAPPAPARVISRFVSDAISVLLKWLKSTAKTAVAGRPMMRFESGYVVETALDGSKLGIEPFAVEVAPGGDLLVLDSVNSNIYRITPPLSRYSRPRLVAGSSEGFAGHIDGKLRDARMNHPEGFTVDDKGNIYVADTMNMAIRKISDTGMTTIAGGKWHKGGHIDGPSEDAKFSNDFEVVYVGSSCSLLVIDRGNQAIREIQLNFDDCAYQYGSGFPLGIAVLFAAGFFGYMLALLQHQVNVMVSPKSEPRSPVKSSIPQSPYEKPFKPSVRPPLIPPEDESEKQEGGSPLTSLGKLISVASSSVAETFGVLSIFRRRPQSYSHLSQHQQQQRPNMWPTQESYIIQDEDEPPPPIEARMPTPCKTYAFMSKEPEKVHHMRQGRAYFSRWEGEAQQQQMHQQHLQQQRHYPSGPKTCYQQGCEMTKEVVFGAVQESDNRSPVDIKPVDYGDSIAYDQHGLRFRMNYVGYGQVY